MSETPKGFFCENRTCRFGIWKDSKFFISKGKKITASLVTALLKERSLFMKNLYSEKTGKTYDATISLETDDAGNAKFQITFPTK